ncbi:DUF1697 domain-containing protein [Streptomyces sp. NPDC051162]|uniref:DUF1697 domain-containing protein n=1 Tax=unclassified Streptomyces TaxID=2593676 RepID=UPI0034310532
MTTKAYAALLRGINVGGHRKVPMADLRALLTEAGYGDVRTHLQSGNAVFTSAATDEAVLAARLSQAVEERFGFAVDVLVRDHAYLKAIADACPFPAASLEPKQLHVTYFANPITAADFTKVDPSRFLPEDFRLGDRALCLYAPDGLGRSKLADVLARISPGVATSRNWNTVMKLVELTGAGG